MNSLAFENPFDRSKHVYRNDAFEEILKDAVRFFNGTPVLPIPPPEIFSGAGVYAIYCIAKSGIYQKFGAKVNRLEYSVPIYVGKAVPAGWRQSRNVDDSKIGPVLSARLHDHAESICSASNLNHDDFACRFMILEGPSIGMISAIEAKLIETKNPLWNSVIDGFGNHNPGGRRLAGKLSNWDTLHPGRPWAAKMSGGKPDANILRQRVRDYLVGLR